MVQLIAVPIVVQCQRVLLGLSVSVRCDGLGITNRTPSATYLAKVRCKTGQLPRLEPDIAVDIHIPAILSVLFTVTFVPATASAITSISSRVFADLLSCVPTDTTGAVCV